MAILPLGVARVSNQLRSSIAQQSIARNQSSLLSVQNELSTGKRLNSPSDDPGDSAILQQLQKTLEQRMAYSDNLKHANSQLSEVDSTLGDLSDLVQNAQTIASANVGSDVTPDQRHSAAAVLESLYSQVLSVANKQFEGSFLFAGDRATDEPFVEATGGVRFVGSSTTLNNAYDENTNLSFQVNGADVFGALSTRVEGTADLTPALTAQTRLTDLAGARSEGVSRGSIRINNGTASAVVDLSACDTVGDVVNAINAAGVGSAIASIDGSDLRIDGGATEELQVTEVGGGTTAADLGLLQVTPNLPGIPIDGPSVGPRLEALTPLADLSGGFGLDVTGGLKITNGQTTANLDFSTCATVEDFLNVINGSNVGVVASINDAGNGINILNNTQGTQMVIAENGGTLAASLGVRSFHPLTQLSELNNGKGVRTAVGDDFQIRRKDGSTFNVDLNNVSTIQDVINAINAADAASPAATGGVAAGFATTGNGITLTDSTGGTQSVLVTPLNFSSAVTDLGLDKPETAGTITGGDVNQVTATGLFSNLSKLRNALENGDQQSITEAAEGLQGDFDRVARIRGTTGARVQELESRQNRLEDQNVATKSLVSSLQDTDFTDAITRFQTIQTALQATMQTTGRMLNQSLMDFLG